MPDWASFSMTGELRTPTNDSVGIYSDIIISVSDGKEPLDDVASNLILHLDATNIDGANNETLTESEEIAMWTDLSENNNHAVKVIIMQTSI